MVALSEEAIREMELPVGLAPLHRLTFRWVLFARVLTQFFFLRSGNAAALALVKWAAHRLPRAVNRVFRFKHPYEKHTPHVHTYPPDPEVTQEG